MTSKMCKTLYCTKGVANRKKRGKRKKINVLVHILVK